MVFAIIYLLYPYSAHRCWCLSFARFIPDYFGILTLTWIIIVTYFYVKHNRWF